MIKLRIVESEYGYDASETFDVLKDYIERQFSSSKWNNLEYKFKQYADDRLIIIITNRDIWNDRGYGTLVFEAISNDPYSGVITAYLNNERYGDFYTQKDYAEWMRKEVENLLY